MTYSLDFRQKVMDYKTKKGLTVEQTSYHFDIGIHTLSAGASHSLLVTSELWSNLVYGDSSGILFLLSSLFNSINELNASNDIHQQLVAS